jgi:hypothetical protein
MPEDGGDGIEHRAAPDIRRIVGEAGQNPRKGESSRFGQVIVGPVRVTDAGGRNRRLLGWQV